MESIMVSAGEATELLLGNDYITILCHANSDGDTLGSAYALCRALLKNGKKARVLCPDEISPRFMYLKDAVRDYGILDELDNFDKNKESFIVTVDVADEKLLGRFRETYKGKISLAIDHHGTNTKYAKRLLLNEKAAANTEIIFYVIKEMGIPLDGFIAACLYTGIATDTGCFKFSNTTGETHAVTAELMKYEFNVSSLNYILFDMKSRERLELERKALDGIEYYFGGKCAIVSLDAPTLEKADPEDVNGISALARQIEGVELGITLKEEKTGVWKISLRSNSYVDCRKICGQFGGGGHLRASGCKINGTFTECKEKLLKEIETHIHI